MGQFGLHIIETPNKRYVFVGSVPVELGYTDLQGQAVDADTVQRQLMLPSKYRAIRTRTYETRQRAEAHARLLGYVVSPK